MAIEEIDVQNFSRKSFGESMDMFLNGCRTSKSGSPVTMQLALPDRASSRYMLSFGSRQTDIMHEIFTSLIEFCNSKMSSSLDSTVRYRSNFGRRKIELNSSKVCWENRMVCPPLDLLKHLSGVLPLEMKALTSTLQSKTTTTYFLFSSFISFRILSSTSGVSPFRSAWVLISSIISSRLLRLVTSCRRVSAMAFFSSGLIFSILSATGSDTSSVIVFIPQIQLTNIAK